MFLLINVPRGVTRKDMALLKKEQRPSSFVGVSSPFYKELEYQAFFCLS